jgi:hypothetical protein
MDSPNIPSQRLRRKHSIAAGQNTTYFLARPNEKLSDLPRHPEEVEHADDCASCGQEKAEDPIVCEKVCYPDFLGRYTE